MNSKIIAKPDSNSGNTLQIPKTQTVINVTFGDSTSSNNTLGGINNKLAKINVTFKGTRTITRYKLSEINGLNQIKNETLKTQGCGGNVGDAGDNVRQRDKTIKYAWQNTITFNQDGSINAGIFVRETVYPNSVGLVPAYNKITFQENAFISSAGQWNQDDPTNAAEKNHKNPSKKFQSF